ncbi:MAG: hypothetical protein UY07_C0009G0021 [Parcubacteria group bacterium GW2011_GWA1_47_8]|nr:MAG: hypothetical protein UY07_C0009G0021 [Parcubacteria group bacterium GW2011_GWA1_47_8]KKW07933.1 MAG: hypothetical protein UY42_C0003G0025 [Parcubacteria group bacterium GW2011_GWA2_49_16]
MKTTKPKILLIHGWNHANYTSQGCTNAWANRFAFTSALSQYFEVVPFNLPGFCGEKDPQVPWGLDDFVSFVAEKIKQEKPEYLLGYSFGGAVALRFKKIAKNTQVNIILVSPAIVRHYENKNLNLTQRILKTLLPENIVAILRDVYLTNIVKNPYYLHASEVMRQTYRNIVSVDLTDDLASLLEPVFLIYGEHDTATPPVLIKNTLSKCLVRHNVHIIPGGGHDIANTHTEKLISIILEIKENIHEDQFADPEANSIGC